MSENYPLVAVPWETRNLGTQSFALTEPFLDDPNKKILREALQEKIEEYGRIFVQARLGKQHLSVAPIIERSGFYFVESTLVPYSHLKKNQRLADFVNDRRAFVPQRFAPDKLDFSLLDKGNQEYQQRVRDIAAESFTDDRFHIDLNCRNELADRRYVFWVDDLFADDSTLFYTLDYGSETIGFMICRGENLLLAGFARSYVNSGLGEYLWLAVLQDMQERGIVQVRTLISSNNTPVLNLYVRMGFKFKDPAATFHYWSS
jgi:ribosomal protein S18 acetylase RimI-like enzyme